MQSKSSSPNCWNKSFCQAISHTYMCMCMFVREVYGGGKSGINTPVNIAVSGLSQCLQDHGYLGAWLSWLSWPSCCCASWQLAAAFNTRPMFPSVCQRQLMCASVKFKFTASKSHLKLRAWISVRRCHCLCYWRFPGAIIERWCTWPTSRKPTVNQKRLGWGVAVSRPGLSLCHFRLQFLSCSAIFVCVYVCVNIAQSASNLATLHIIFP